MLNLKKIIKKVQESKNPIALDSNVVDLDKYTKIYSSDIIQYWYDKVDGGLIKYDYCIYSKCSWSVYMDCAKNTIEHKQDYFDGIKMVLDLDKEAPKSGVLHLQHKLSWLTNQYICTFCLHGPDHGKLIPCLAEKCYKCERFKPCEKMRLTTDKHSCKNCFFESKNNCNASNSSRNCQLIKDLCKEIVDYY